MIKKYLNILNDNRYYIQLVITERIFFFISFLIIARKFPADVYGELITIFSLAHIFITIFEIGLPSLIQIEVSSNKKNTSEFTSDVLILFIIIFPVYFISAIIFSQLYFPSISLKITLLILLSLYFISAANLFNRLLYGLNEYRKPMLSMYYSRIPVLILIISAALFFDANVTAFLLLILLSGVIQTLINFLIVKRTGKFLSFSKFKLSKILKISIISLPLGLAVLFNFLYDKIDLLLISRLSGFDQAAYYNIAYGIYKSTDILFSFLFITGISKVSSISKNYSELKIFFKSNFILLLKISIVITLILILTSELLISTVYTGKFIDSVNTLRILSFALTGLALNNLTGIMLNGMGYYSENMKVTLLGLILNIILNFIFIPVYGIVASAVITVFTEYLIFAGGYFYLNKILNKKYI